MKTIYIAGTYDRRWNEKYKKVTMRTGLFEINADYKDTDSLEQISKRNIVRYRLAEMITPEAISPSHLARLKAKVYPECEMKHVAIPPEKYEYLLIKASSRKEAIDKFFKEDWRYPSGWEEKDLIKVLACNKTEFLNGRPVNPRNGRYYLEETVETLSNDQLNERYGRKLSVKQLEEQTHLKAYTVIRIEGWPGVILPSWTVGLFTDVNEKPAKRNCGYYDYRHFVNTKLLAYKSNDERARKTVYSVLKKPVQSTFDVDEERGLTFFAPDDETAIKLFVNQFNTLI